MDTSLRQATDTFETVNGQLGSCLCSKKHLKTNVGAPHDSKLPIFRFCSVPPIHSVYFCAFRPQSRLSTLACNERLILQRESDSTFLLQSSSFCCFVQV